MKTNVGGVGIAMLLLIFARLYMQKTDRLPKLTELGVEYWGAMYIPVVVAMAATQDMVAALRGGPVAVLAAIGAAALCACVIAAINRTERSGRSAGRDADPAREPPPGRSGVSTMIEILEKAAAQTGSSPPSRSSGWSS